MSENNDKGKSDIKMEELIVVSREIPYFQEAKRQVCTALHTHKDINNGPMALLWSKMAIFKWAWWKVKVLPHLWSIKIILKSLLRRIYKKFFQLWQLVFLEPLGVPECNVPHFKGLISANLNLIAQGHGGTFTFCHALFKKAILHLKIGYRPKLCA